MTSTSKGVARQAAMVFDLNKCMGCQTCSVACKMLWTRDEGTDYQWWCTVNTLPGRGHPRDWETMGGGYRDGKLAPGRVPEREEWGGGWQFNHEEAMFGGKGRDTFLQQVGEKPTWGPNWEEDQGAGEFPNAYSFYMPRLCNHCTKPACVEACPESAMYKRAEDGIVLRDEGRCKGHQACAAACPYKKIYFNHVRKVSQHCIMCFPRVEQMVAPACARQCPGRAVWFGMLDDEDGPVAKLVRKWKVALPLHPEYGTGPNVFYIPPIGPARLDASGNFDESKPRIPTEYLEGLFGPAVGPALDTLAGEMRKTRSGGKSELMDTLVAYWWKDMFAPYDRNPADIDWG